MNAAQMKRIRSRRYAAFANGTTTIVSAFLKENAVKELQRIDPAVNAEDVYDSNQPGGHQTTVDEIIEVGRGNYEIRMKAEED